MPPEQVVERAAARGVQVLALTDHDELRGLAAARDAAIAAGIRLIDGVEVSATWRGHTLHVLGIGVHPDDARLQEGLQRNRSGRDDRAARIAAQLDSIGIPGALDGARAYVTNPELVSRTHFARFLVAGGYARDTQAVFDRFLGTGKPAHVPHQWAAFEEAIGWISGAGGLPVLAHPARYKLDENLRTALLEAFREAGGVGLEVVSGSHTPDECVYWARKARQYGFLASAGSDFHGPVEGHRDFGLLPALPAGCAPVWERL